MRVHPNQVNPNAQLDAMHAAQKAEARRQAARTRKKLMQFASQLAGGLEAEDLVVTLEEGEGRESQRQDEQQGHGAKANDESEPTEPAISDWA